MNPENWTVDRTGWPSGEWDDEKDYYHFRHAGLPCLIVRNAVGSLCGYAGVTPGHPLYEVPYTTAWDEKPNGLMASIRVHGGLTYSSKCRGPICHPRTDGEPEPWWLGFDCAHAWDLTPGMPVSRFDIYRSMEYVKRQVEGLAEQLVASSSSIFPFTGMEPCG